MLSNKIDCAVWIKKRLNEWKYYCVKVIKSGSQKKKILQWAVEFTRGRQKVGSNDLSLCNVTFVLYLMSWVVYNGWEHSMRSIISGESILAHARSIVYHKSGYIFIDVGTSQWTQSMTTFDTNIKLFVCTMKWCERYQSVVTCIDSTCTAGWC